ncbi:MAG: hypothetical protein K2J93_07075, partial [Anaeroplasmataceae bacterium]|nr:hypothetical protein [Anaeroplasmataceae bacterium]
MKKRKKDKIFLKFFIIFILGMIGSIAMLGFFIYQYKNNQYSYQDLELKRYTFLAYERKRVAY